MRENSLEYIGSSAQRFEGIQHLESLRSCTLPDDNLSLQVGTFGRVFSQMGPGTQPCKTEQFLHTSQAPLHMPNAIYLLYLLFHILLKYVKGKFINDKYFCPNNQDAMNKPT